jgi:hypothetical protein
MSRPAGGLNVMARGTRKEIIAEIMKLSATWGSPLSREQAEAKAGQTIKATRPHWGWFIVFIIVAVLWALTAGAWLQVRLSVNIVRSWFRFWGGDSGCEGRFGPSG